MFVEIKIVRQQAGIHHQQNAMLIAYGANVAQVLDGYRLAANQVGTCFHAHKRNVLRTVLGNQRLESINIQITLERLRACHLQATALNDLFHPPAIERDMRLGGGEVVVHRHDAAGFDKSLRQNVFAGTALVRRQKIFHAENLA